MRAKLRGQEGASILLALLFFLVCAMVSASVLMAAVSNAGKIRSNRVEQQKYLALSSAMQLVCDELEAAEYVGMYTYDKYYGYQLNGLDYRQEERHYTAPPPDPVINMEKDSYGHDVEVTYYWELKYTRHIYTQKEGSFTCGIAEALPQMRDDLDAIFAQAMERFCQEQEDDKNRYELTTCGTRRGTHDLTVSTGLDESFGPLADVVFVSLVLGEETSPDADAYRIRLTAVLKGTDTYVGTDYERLLEAELLHRGETPAPELEPADSNETGKLSWEVKWISKEEFKE